jgi:hypothetical protein
MRIGRRSLNVLALAALLGMAATGATPVVGAAKPALAIVVSRDSSIRDLSFYELKRAFLGENVAAGGKRLIPLNFPPNSRERTAFDKVVLGMSQEEAARYWIDRKIRGQPGSPRAITPVEVLMKVVARLDGAVTYADPRDLNPGVKIVTIDGKGPEDPGYPITF